MFRRQVAGLIVGFITALTLCCMFTSGLAGSQEEAKNHTPAVEKAEQKAKDAPPLSSAGQEERGAQIRKMLNDYDVKPHAPQPIPDDPPPHEGALLGFDHIVEPPDLVMVEVLEALPGRPISGERLVKPDGTISLGFYGDVYVTGMTLKQVKVAIIKHLSTYLNDDALGLEMVTDEAEIGKEATERPAIPELPKASRNPFEPDDPKDKTKPRPSSERSRSIPRPIKPRPVSGRSTATHIPVRRIRSRSAQLDLQDQQPLAPAQDPIKIPLGTQGKVTITIEPNAQESIDLPTARDAGVDQNLRRVIVSPAESPHVFVDITAYNSKNYYVLGDVLVTGKLPWTGNETVLDALQYAGGLLSSAEPKDIRVVRPARGGKPARVYKVDLDAIQNKGDVTTNYQIFPNDRLIVGRNEVVKKTAEIDRLNAPIQAVTGILLQEAFMLRALQFATADNREELLKEFVDFWTKELARPGGIKFDEQTLRDALTRKMKLTPAPLQTTPAPR